MRLEVGVQHLFYVARIAYLLRHQDPTGHRLLLYSPDWSDRNILTLFGRDIVQEAVLAGS